MKYKTVLSDAEGNDDRSIVPSNLESFYRFLYDRQAVWHNRFVKKLPRENWTEDPYLKKSKYTNIHRELDRGTIWWFDHIAPIWKSNKLPKNKRKKEIIWQTCIYRLLNKCDTFDQIGVPSLNLFRQEDVRQRWVESIQRLLDEDIKVWSSATITLQSNLKATRLENLQTILGKLLDRIDDLVDNIIATKSIEGVFKYLHREYGIGPFTAYEIATDLSYLDCFGLDIDEWANAGPGCMPGIKLIFPWASKKEDYVHLMKLLRDNQQKAFAKYGIPFHEVMWVRYLNLRDVEHSLCEWRKYYSQVRNIGRPRVKYDKVVLPNTIHD